MIKLIALLKRRPPMTREEFATRWLDEHTKISSRLPGLKGYRINIATPRQPEGVGDEPLYDGTAELWWDSIDAMEESFGTDIGKIAGDDGDSFAEVRLHIYTDEYNIVQGPGKEPPPRGPLAEKLAKKKKAVKKSAPKKAAKKTKRTR